MSIDVMKLLDVFRDRYILNSTFNMNLNSTIVNIPPLSTVRPILSQVSDETWLRVSQWCLVALTLIFADRIARTLLRNYSFSRFSKASGCLPVTIAANPFPLPWSVGRKYEVYKASVAGDLFEGHFLRKYTKYGNTHAIVSPVLGTQKGINTVEPENIKTVLATRFEDYKRPKFRSLAAQPMLLPGLFTTDGYVETLMIDFGFPFSRSIGADQLLGPFGHIGEPW